MRIVHIFKEDLARNVDQLYVPSSIDLSDLWIKVVYEEFLYKKKGLEEDLFLIFKEKNSQYFYESLILDDLRYILDSHIVQGDKVFRERVEEEFLSIVNVVRRVIDKYDLYRNNILTFQSIDFIDPSTIGFFKVRSNDVEGQ